VLKYLSLISIFALFSSYPVMAQLAVSPASVSFSTATGLQTQSISVTSTSSAPVSFTVSTDSTNNWLGVTPVSGVTPVTLQVYVANPNQPSSDTPYTGSITITPSAGGPQVTVSATFTISSTANNPIGVSPGSLSFTVAQGNTNVQTLQLTSFGVATLASVVSENDWLKVAPMVVSVSPGNSTPVTVAAIPGDQTPPSSAAYSSTLLITAVNGAGAALSPPVRVPVTMTVTGPPPPALAFSPTQLSFNLPAGSSSVAPQTVQVVSTGANVTFTTTATSSPAGLIVAAPAAGTTPAVINVSVSPTVVSTLSAGSYAGSITVTPTGAPAQSVAVSVTVQPPLPPSISTLVNSANNASGPISPGELITVYGMNLGPANAAGLQLTPNGLVATRLANTLLTFDGIPAPLTYVSSGQMNAIVPYELVGRTTSNVLVQRNGVSSAGFQQAISDTAPGIFSSILNQDNTPNSSANPVSRGSVIQIFATGEGILIPPIPTGSVTPSTPPLAKPAARVAVTIGGVAAPIQYVGEAPGLVSGVLQVNVVVPDTIGTGPQPIVLSVGAADTSRQPSTVVVK
jgi:uncharacterized protein (TIGR03437 family)